MSGHLLAAAAWRSVQRAFGVGRVTLGMLLLVASCGSPPPWPQAPLPPAAPVPPSATATAAPPTPVERSGACPHGGEGREFSVGPGLRYENIGDVPFELLSA